MLGWARLCFHKKCDRTHCVEHVFLHLVGSVGHVVHSGAYGSKASMYYFSCSAGTGIDSTKSAPGDITPTLSFCI
jgi:hypothetical protein